MNHRIIGTTLPVLELKLDAGDSIIAVSGELSWMGQSIDMHTTTQFGSGGIGGIFKRMVGGGSLFMTEYTAKGAPGILHLPRACRAIFCRLMSPRRRCI
jgi:uncharacterized protein (AIM24 family)